jgi:DNA-binding GntR family transcriptional regulator
MSVHAGELNHNGSPRRERMINSTSLRDQVYSYLRSEIKKGRLEPGSSINLDKISRELGISKTPLKEALIKLECEGFVGALPRRGFQVKQLTQQELKDYYEIIGNLESGVVYSVFDQLKAPAIIEKMKQSNTEQGNALKSKDFDRYYLLNLEFHDFFLNLSDNTALRELVIPMKKRLYDFPRQNYWEEWELVNLDEHRRFIAALEIEDRSTAAAVMRDEHWGWKKHEPYFVRFYNFSSTSSRK